MPVEQIPARTLQEALHQLAFEEPTLPSPGPITGVLNEPTMAALRAVLAEDYDQFVINGRSVDGQQRVLEVGGNQADELHGFLMAAAARYQALPVGADVPETLPTRRRLKDHHRWFLGFGLAGLIVGAGVYFWRR